MSQPATRATANRITGKEPAAAVALEIAFVMRVPRSWGCAAPTRGSSRSSSPLAAIPHLHALLARCLTPPPAAEPVGYLIVADPGPLGSAYRRERWVPVAGRPCHRKAAPPGGDMGDEQRTDGGDRIGRGHHGPDALNEITVPP